MKILLISPNTERLVETSLALGMGLVAAATRKAGHEVAFLDLMARNDGLAAVDEILDGFRADLVGISVRNVDDQNQQEPRLLLEPARDLVRRLRARSEAPVVLGGAGYSIYPESALAYLGADLGIQGEGELAFPMLADRLELGKDLSGIPGLYRAGSGLQKKRVFPASLDSFGLDEDLLHTSAALEGEKIWFPYQTRRGCAMDCSYCSTSTIEGRLLRKRSPEQVVHEIAGLADKGIRRIYFVDNTFNIPGAYARELSRRLADSELEIAWRAILYPWKVDGELVREMARAGCKEVTLGFESGSEQVLRGMNKRFRPPEVREIARIFADHGIRRFGTLLLGGPGETRESVEETLAFADSLGLEFVGVSVGVRVYPYTRLAEIARAEGLVRPGDDLLLPRFYLAPGLEGWAMETVRSWAAGRPNWLV